MQRIGLQPARYIKATAYRTISQYRDMKRHDISISLLGYDMITKDNIIKFCHTFRYGLFLKFVFQHLPGPNRARLLVVYVVTPRPLLSLLWNNFCNLVYQTPSETYRSQIPAVFV